MVRQCLLVGIIVFFNVLRAQDPQFSQYYAAPLFLNPAMTGATSCDRVGAIARTQWTGLPRAFNTASVYADVNMSSIHSGIGIMALHDDIGTARFSSDELSLFYSYLAPVSEHFNVRFGIQGTYVSRSINYSQLIFEDQFTGTLVTQDNTADPVSEHTRVSYGDISAGIFFFNEKFYWLGFSVHHLNEPNQSFYIGESKLPRKYTLHGGVHISFFDDHGLHKVKDRSLHITPTFLYKSETKFDQLDLGVYLLKTNLIFGVWYRGIIFKEDEGIRNNDALVLQLGLKAGDLAVIYSYDMTTSTLDYRNTHGSHEISITYEFCTGWPKRKHNYKRLPCPDFLKSQKYKHNETGF